MEFELKTLSPEAVSGRSRRPSDIGCSRSPSKPRASASTRCRSTRRTTSALVTLLLALTDQFGRGPAVGGHGGLQVVRAARDHHLRMRATAGSCGNVARRRSFIAAAWAWVPQVYVCLREAMTWYERAEAIRPAGNDDTLLRWNTCARLIMRDQRLMPPLADERSGPLFLE